MSDEKGSPEAPHAEIDISVMGNRIKATPDAVIRTVTSVGTLALLGAFGWWELTVGRPEIVQSINTGWEKADRLHQERLIDEQKRQDKRFDDLVERHAESIQSLKEVLSRKVVEN